MRSLIVSVQAQRLASLLLTGLFFVLMCSMMPAVALQQLQFEQQQMQEDYEHLIHTVRCAVCANQPIAESQATVAKDLRQEIATRIRAGESRQSIEQALLQRYGDAIFYSPPKTSATALLWGGPFVLLLIGLFFFRKVFQ